MVDAAEIPHGGCIAQRIHVKLANDGPLLDQKDAVGKRADKIYVLFDQENGQPAAYPQRFQLVDNFLNNRRLNALDRKSSRLNSSH